MTNAEYAAGLAHAVFFLIACDLQLSANEDLLEADRVEGWNAPWARFLRRRAGKKRYKARYLAPGAYEGDYAALEGHPRGG